MKGRGAPETGEIDAWLGNVRHWRGTPPEDGPPSILIGGPVRCGKSSVAKMLAGRTGMVVLPTDAIDRRFCKAVPPGHERAILGPVLRHVLNRFPRGLILEGVMLCERAALVLPTAQVLALPVHVIGYADGSVERKLAHIEAYRATGDCWTLQAGLDREALRRQAHAIIAESRVLRARSEAMGFVYHELDSARFASEVMRVADRIAPDRHLPELDRTGPL